MTYLAGLEAQIIVWIAADFREAHLSALKWLNENTVEPFAFFAVKIKAVRIGDSPIAILFKVVMRPNHWERQLQAIAKEKRTNSDLGEFRKRFWNHYLTKYPDELQYGLANGLGNRWRPVENSDFVISIYLAQKSIGVFIRGHRGIDSNITYGKLKPYEEYLENKLGVPLGTYVKVLQSIELP